MFQALQTSVVPRDCGGKWIAWNADRTKIVAIERTFGEAKQAAAAAGELNPVLAKVPRPDIRFLGGKR